jgi:hypothetical protein
MKGFGKILGNKVFVYILLAVLAGGCAFLLAMGFIVIPVFIIGGLIGILVVYYCLSQPLLGFYLVTIISYFVAYPDRLLRMSVPLSTGIEVLVLLLFLATSGVKYRSGSVDFIRHRFRWHCFFTCFLSLLNFLTPTCIQLPDGYFTCAGF